MKIKFNGKTYKVDSEYTLRHLHKSLRRQGLYRDSSKGIFSGICAGLSRKFNISLSFIRFIFFFAALFSGIFPVVILYVIASFIMENHNDEIDLQQLQILSKNEEESSYFNLGELTERFDNLDKKLQTMESFVISPQFDLLNKYKNL